MKALTGRGRAPNIYEVAERAGVSIATVSRVQRGNSPVSAPTRDRVRSAIREMAYRPSHLARSLARGGHEAIGIVFPDLSGPYYSAVILGFEEASSADGRSALILGTHRRADMNAQVLALADRVDGIVVTGRTVADDVVAELVRRGVPTVLLARPAAGDADSVCTESRDTARALVSHVIEHGRRDIAFLGDPTMSPDASERWAGFRRAHEAAGRATWRDAVACGYREADGREAAKQLLAEAAPPDAIVAANDEIAMGVLSTARDAGIRVPDVLVVTGWDDIPVAGHLAPPLTTVRQPMEELGRRAAALLHERLTGIRTIPRHEVLPTELVVRSSCGCHSSRSEGESKR